MRPKNIIQLITVALFAATMLTVNLCTPTDNNEQFQHIDMDRLLGVTYDATVDVAMLADCECKDYYESIEDLWTHYWIEDDNSTKNYCKRWIDGEVVKIYLQDEIERLSH